MKKLICLPLLALLLLAGCTKEGSQPADTMPGDAITFRGEYVPFSASTDLQTVGFGDKCPGPIAEVAIPILEGTGKALHLGKVELRLEHCLFRPGSSDPFSLKEGEGIFTAANGDLLRILYEGSWAVNPMAQEITITASFNFDGGSGRFDDAKGSGTMDYVAYFPEWPPNPPNDVAFITADFKGAISY